MFRILAINPGSTSTKIALYEDEKEINVKNITHSNEQIEKYERIADQYELRYKEIVAFLEEMNVAITDLDAVVGRGGLLPPVQSGAYEVNETMVECLKNKPVVEHASNLGGIIAYEIAKIAGVKAFIYDAIATDQLSDIARISGIKDIKRKSFVHTLNMRSTAILTAKKLDVNYEDLNMIVAHLGGGLTISLHHRGQMEDIVSDDEGPFSPERSGRLPGKDLMKLCYKEDAKSVGEKLRGKGGLVSYLGTNDAREVEKMISEGDDHAAIIYEAMAYQIAKGIGELATVVNGNVDVIVITGGIAYSEMFTQWIEDRVKFIAPVEIVPGENELKALSEGVLRVLRGEEVAKEYIEK